MGDCQYGQSMGEQSIIKAMRSSSLNLAQAVRKTGLHVLNALLPPLCPVTNAPLMENGSLSAEAWAQIQFIDDPVCAGCGAPFEHDYGEGALCALCIAEPPAFVSARAALLYDDASHDLIISFKHSDRADLAPLFGKWLAHAGKPLVTSKTILTPTPLHWRRLLKRRFNQAGLIALEAARSLGCAYEPLLLRRNRATPPQKDLSIAARRRNVAGAFMVEEEALTKVHGAHIVLVDDVLTTGATLSACSRSLYSAGAARVDALVLARVVKHSKDAI